MVSLIILRNNLIQEESTVSMHYSFITLCLSCVFHNVHFTIGGDGWRAGSSKVIGQPIFRQAFSRELNEIDNTPIYDDPIGDAASRPLGTKYENTSYAHIHKNVLFVTVDAFHDTGSNYYKRKLSRGGHGVITCTVVGEHLIWFENVLKAGRDDPSIKHIFVQAHIPVLQPVRKINSSGQYMDGAEKSGFWKAMQLYGVDIYFVGEVHANTVIKDPHSNVIQITSRANRLNNFLSVEVGDEDVVVSVYNEVGEKWR